MLVLTRKIGEAVIIDGDIRVVVREIAKNNTVRLGIDAPDGVQVHREEIQREIEGVDS